MGWGEKVGSPVRLARKKRAKTVTKSVERAHSVGQDRCHGREEGGALTEPYTDTLKKLYNRMQREDSVQPSQCSKGSLHPSKRQAMQWRFPFV